MSAWLLAGCRFADPADGVGTATDSAGTPDDTTSAPTTSATTEEPDPEPEPETAGSACGEPLPGQWGDCINGNAQACGNEDASCLANSTSAPAWGTCILPCQDRCDCWAPVEGSSAEPACEPVLAMGQRACVLSCSDGQTCPDGMSCRALTGVVSICAHDNADFDPTGGPDPSTSTGSASTSTGPGPDTDTDASSSGSSSGTTTTGA